ncbi:putative oxidoreductase [Cohaesibacter marisflavi]|uniref:Putative oxidoreductase n=1 Tax=Cohaesibacter marisflavi TaxID=655353 RepID=A0A1I5CGA3_9HYPH|nr:DoxX family protein [Cohaesibacter marisflavi]SFN85937.1 putative oxidoreductase [Cohaesibacter marisflavi]
MIDNQSAPYAAFLLRVISGALLLAHGLMKIFIFTIPGTVGFFESLGFPGLFAYLTIFAEVVGGAALILGVATRAVAILTLPPIIGALFVHSGNGWVFSSEGGGWEFPLFWAITNLSIALLGSGAFALRLPVVNQKLAWAQ